MKRLQLIHDSLSALTFDSIFWDLVARIPDISLCGLSSGYLQGALHESVHLILRIAELEYCRLFQLVDNKTLPT